MSSVLCLYRSVLGCLTRVLLRMNVCFFTTTSLVLQSITTTNNPPVQLLFVWWKLLLANSRLHRCVINVYIYSHLCHPPPHSGPVTLIVADVLGGSSSWQLSHGHIFVVTQQLHLTTAWTAHLLTETSHVVSLLLSEMFFVENVFHTGHCSCSDVSRFLWGKMQPYKWLLIPLYSSLFDISLPWMSTFCSRFLPVKKNFFLAALGLYLWKAPRDGFIVNGAI